MTSLEWCFRKFQACQRLGTAGLSAVPCFTRVLEANNEQLCRSAMNVRVVSPPIAKYSCIIAFRWDNSNVTPQWPHSCHMPGVEQGREGGERYHKGGSVREVVRSVIGSWDNVLFIKVDMISRVSFQHLTGLVPRCFFAIGNEKSGMRDYLRTVKVCLGEGGSKEWEERGRGA